MAMHPFGLMSTVYPLACSVCPPSSHSTVNCTREFSRSPDRTCSPRVSAKPSILATFVSSVRGTAQANKHTWSLSFTVSTPFPTVNGTSATVLPTSHFLAFQILHLLLYPLYFLYLPPASPL